jgi:hypothetical protein
LGIKENLVINVELCGFKGWIHQMEYKSTIVKEFRPMIADLFISVKPVVGRHTETLLLRRPKDESIGVVTAAKSNTRVCLGLKFSSMVGCSAEVIRFSLEVPNTTKRE